MLEYLKTCNHKITDAQSGYKERSSLKNNNKKTTLLIKIITSDQNLKKTDYSH